MNIISVFFWQASDQLWIWTVSHWDYWLYYIKRKQKIEAVCSGPKGWNGKKCVVIRDNPNPLQIHHDYTLKEQQHQSKDLIENLSSAYISSMTGPSCSSMARVNSPEEIPNSSSLVQFLSELFPVGRALQGTARSSSMNHLDIVMCVFPSTFLQLHWAVRMMLLSGQD